MLKRVLTIIAVASFPNALLSGILYQWITDKLAPGNVLQGKIKDGHFFVGTAKGVFMQVTQIDWLTGWALTILFGASWLLAILSIVYLMLVYGFKLVSGANRKNNQGNLL